MDRSVLGHCTLPEDGTIELALCDKYGRVLGEESVSVTIGTDGVFAVDLEINENDTCWVAVNNEPKRAFWVFDGENEQAVDLTQRVYPRNTLPVFLSVSTAEAALNAEKSINEMACGVPIVCEEEQRFLCRYDEYSEGEEDIAVCKIDTKLGENNV